MPRAYVKISVYVPASAVTRASDGVHFEAPAGTIRSVIGTLNHLGAAIMGPYDNVTFTTPGNGNFRPIPDLAKPSSGMAGELYEAKGEVISFVAPRRNVKQIIAEIAKNHPYETPHIEVGAMIRHAYDGLPD